MAVADAAFGDDVAGEVSDLVGRAFEDGDFEAGSFVEMEVHGGDGERVVGVEGVGETAGEVAGGVVVDVDEGGGAGLAGLVNAALIGVVLLCLTPVFRHMPLNALAAIVITGVIGLTNLLR